MSRYIEADALIIGTKENNLGKWYVGRIDGKPEEVIPTDTVYKIIDTAPSIDIVLCKECRYRKKKRGAFKGEPIIFYRCTENNRDVESDDYCSWGERSRRES